MNKDTLELNLQFFAEDAEADTSVIDPEVADLEGEVETSDVDATENTEVEETPDEKEAEPVQQQTPEQNRIFANMRRRAEEEARNKYQAEQARIDAMYAEKFRGYTNPETGAPILTAADYVEAMAAQDRMEAKQQMQSAGVDPGIIDRAIANSPLMQQAQAAIEASNQMQSQRMIEEDMRNIIAFDPSVSSQQDIVMQDNFGEVVEYCNAHPGIRLSDAYKLVNFDRLSSIKSQAAQQQAINQVKSKGHLAQTSGLADQDKSEDIPESEIAEWREWFPDKTPKELKALYNKQKHNGG